MTRLLRTLIVPALAFVASVSVAQADYSYSLVTNSPTPITGVSYTALNGTTAGNGPSIPPVLQLSFGSALAAGNYNLSFSELITGSSGSQTFTINGTLSVIASGSAFVTTYVANSVTSTNPTGGPGYSVPAQFVNYLPLNATGNPAQIGLAILPNAAVPEPASVVMLGLGLIGTAGFAARRRLA